MRLGRKKNIVGLDIGSSAVKLVELKSGKGGRYSLVHAAHAPLSPEAIVEGTVMDSSLVVDVAKRLLQERGVKNPNFGISLSGISVAIRKIQVPAMSAEELDELDRRGPDVKADDVLFSSQPHGSPFRFETPARGTKSRHLT